MRILYAIQATGNGHISRAMQLLPFLEQAGTVDIFLSGGNSSLQLDAPVKYRSKGLSLYYNCEGGLDYWRILRGIHPLRLRQEIRDLPVEKYDLVLNDFDYITAAACQRKKVPSIQFGHQASFQSAAVPRPESRNMMGEWVLKNYAKARQYVGLHFQRYDDFIFTPVIRRDILEAVPTDGQYITVYLPSYCEKQLLDVFIPVREFCFEIFCGQISAAKRYGHLTLLPVEKQRFSSSLIHCTGIITGGGFETPAEALHLGKKIMTIPIRGQYEQQCNAAALEQMGIPWLKSTPISFRDEIYRWLQHTPAIRMDYSRSIPDSLEYLFACVTEQQGMLSEA